MSADPTAPGFGPGLGRRTFLRGAALGTAVGAGVGAGVLVGAESAAADQDGGPGEAGRRIPFEGPHQAGITTPPQASATFASFNVTATDRAGLDQLFQIGRAHV